MEDREILMERFLGSLARNKSEDDDRHLRQCWRIQDCGHCVSSNHKCGWCPYSSTCVPLFNRGHLLSPIYDAQICPMPWQERWELRTGTFGCNCSTTTFLAAIITCISTLTSLLILWIIWKVLKYVFSAVFAPRGGWRIDVVDEIDGEHWRQGVWVRKGIGFTGRLKNAWRRIGMLVKTRNEDDIDPQMLVVEESRPLLS
ncbi:uncharacterized protein PV09_02172 [Verruconis gallopava]|uniref:PSI domain-containing protein n=1 Tax=Verruconis gallopava TaxID=253628 RepID=A0A0D1Z2Z7_9PEZI|nr:uncharacterized protein PV09_02172 [Verruconis gallopava]KIW07322.1 hypothetical protein PV09_02172 [Verruconis gallopava]